MARRKSTDKPIQKLAIRLLKPELQPRDCVGSLPLLPFMAFENAYIAFGTNGGQTPKWANFLELDEGAKKQLKNVSTYALVFVKVEKRWFVVTFGTGFSKLETSCSEHGFGLKVVINSVDEKKLKSADVSTPDENTTTRRTQASKNSSQEIFEIDHERDLIRGLEGIPRNPLFASKVTAHGLRFAE